MDIQLYIGNKDHGIYAEEICAEIEASARVRGTGIAKREPEYIRNKLEKGNAIIALDGDQFVGFCYIEIFDSKKYVSNSGLIVKDTYRQMGIAKQIKYRAFELARDKFPQARIFGITTSLAVMKINSELGYKPVTYSELTQDDEFWKGCQSCPNYDILMRNNRKMCLCTGMLAASKLEQMNKELTDKKLETDDEK
ncbi:MAG TPA: GNAT family N-acetyltransferase [Membranihabitans sp.]|nr:GNAT family N-acetyltransferase [Membranihabitans sp.]